VAAAAAHSHQRQPDAKERERLVEASGPARDSAAAPYVFILGRGR
jgi:hypothetical protein